MGRVSDVTSWQIRLLLAVSTAAFTAACINVGLGGEGSPQAQYRLEDLSPKVQPRSTPIDRRLLLSTTPFESIGDTHSMAYSRTGQQREFYQFASWTEVTAELIERRGRHLVQRKRFIASAPVAAENAPSAVAALSRALTTLFDELVPWLERTAEALPPPEPRPARDGKS